MTSAAYYREYRRTHPEYRERERERSRRRKRGDRTAEYKRASSRRRQALAGTIPEQDPIITWARTEATKLIKPDHRNGIVDPMFDDVVGELLVGRYERGVDPVRRARDWMTRERWYRSRVIPLP